MTSLPAWNTYFEFLSNPDDTISDPIVQALGNGTFVVLWEQNNSSGEGRLWMRIVDADGTPKSDVAEIALAADVTTQNKYDPAVTVLSNGNFVVTWDDYSDLDGDTVAGVRGKIFNSSGVGIGDDFRVNSKLDGAQFESSVTALADGRFAVAYSDLSGDGDGSAVRTRIFDSLGRPVLRAGETLEELDDIFANATTTKGQVSPATTALQDGGYVVFYEDYSVSVDDPYTTIRGRTFKADGTPGSETDFLIPSTGLSGGKRSPVATTLADGRFVVAWEYDKDDSGYKTIKARVFNADGTPASDEFGMHEEGEPFQRVPKIVALQDGGFAISYISGDFSDIHIATFSGDGVFRANIAVAFPENASLETEPSIAVLTDGRLVVSWIDHDYEADVYGAHAQFFDPRTGAVKLDGTADDDHYIGTGFNDILSGFTGVDKLEGAGGDDVLDGGAGADILAGGTGNDTYYVDSGDVVIEGSGGGYDVIIASYSASLGNDTNVEVLQAAAGTAGYSLGGGNMNDTLIGNSGHNVLNGGTGNDRMVGGAGNDTYYVDSRWDSVVETGTANGIDLVMTSISYTLAAYVEKLIGIGSGAISLTGNSLNNTLTGNAAANVLKGSTGHDTLNGGLGNDQLWGGTGADKFVFTTAPNAWSNKDKILDWNYREDTILLENAVFTRLKAGALASSSFRLGSKALDSNDFVGYNKLTGDVWYDSNANRAGGQVVIANIGKDKPIFSTDFVVI